MKVAARVMLGNVTVVAALAVALIPFVGGICEVVQLPPDEEAIRARGGAALEELSLVAARLLALGDRERLARIAGRYEAASEVVAVGVWDEAGEAVVALGQVEQLEAARQHRFEAGLQRLGGGIGAGAMITSDAGTPVGQVALVYGLGDPERVTWRLAGLILVVLLGFAASALVTARLAHGASRSLRALTRAAKRIGAGDLQASLPTPRPGDPVAELTESLGAMLTRVHEVTERTSRAVAEVKRAASEILVSSQQQQQGATEQSAAVDETRRTMESLLGSGREVTRVAQGVLENAEMTQRNNHMVSEGLGKLSGQISRIGEILAAIKEVANKSDLLALNAALEGIKAGEVGRGFSLVARQMQRLAENVMNAVTAIKGLTGDIREATAAVVLATEEANKLAGDTTRSARQISLIVQHQQSGTEQVTRAMDDVALIAQQAAVGSGQALQIIQELIEHAQLLEHQIGKSGSRSSAST